MVGACHGGYWQCDDNLDEDTAVCAGETFPTPEVCDNIDNDCDGKVDDMPGLSLTNECGRYISFCEDGGWHDYGVKHSKPEVCNGKDDDCNGIVDDNIVFDNVFCYDGPAATQGKGECRPGFTTCMSGSIYCANEVLPAPETCNGKDDDCNGKVDDGVGSTKPIDIAVYSDDFDDDGSASSIKTAFNDLTIKYQNYTNIKWGLVADPDIDNTPALRANLGSMTTFNTAVQQYVIQTALGSEPILDAIAMVCDPANPLHLNWTPGAAKYLMVFVDEGPVSAATPPLIDTDVANMCLHNSVTIRVYASDSTQWQNFVAITDAWVGDVGESSTQLENDIGTMLQQQVCQ